VVTLGGIVLKVGDADRAARFWSAALGYVAEAERPWVLHPPAGGPLLFLDEDDRSHLDLWADAGEQDAEILRLVALGATRPAWDSPPGADHVVLADPDGNLFCVVRGGTTSPDAQGAP
jgi:catechol 2,3-dioxygenase-like lactoylglutathione lyase family enzyme